MGLDVVEFFMDVEDAFELSIPSVDAATLRTPRKLIDYLCDRLETPTEGPPLAQRAFYRLRVALADELGINRRAIRPGSTVLELAPDRSSTDVWKSVAARIAVRDDDVIQPIVARWFRVPQDDTRTIGAVADELAMKRPLALTRASNGLTREQITGTMYRLLNRVISFDARPVGLDADFIHDLGMG